MALASIGAVGAATEFRLHVLREGSDRVVANGKTESDHGTRNPALVDRDADGSRTEPTGPECRDGAFEPHVSVSHEVGEPVGLLRRTDEERIPVALGQCMCFGGIPDRRVLRARPP